MNGPPSSTPTVNSNGSRATVPQPTLSAPTKRRAEEQLVPNGRFSIAGGTGGSPSSFKKACVENAATEEAKIVAPDDPKEGRNRAASAKPASLREDADERIKRAKLDTANWSTSLQSVTTSSCHSCRDTYLSGDMLQLTCKGVNDARLHAYCSDCVTLYFESALTDPRQCPPRCCSRAMPLASCKPFMADDLVRRFETHVKPSRLFQPDPRLGVNKTSIEVFAFEEGTQRPTVNISMRAECASCFEKFLKFDILQLSCKHDDDTSFQAYCRDCVAGLFEASITDSSLLPPRCCAKVVSLFNYTPYLAKELIARFIAKEELDAPNRTYCNNTDCSRWVCPDHIQAEVANCPQCSQKTCTTCKGKHHDGLCPEDSGVKQLMGHAQQNKWQTCPNCEHMVELDRGCHHITSVYQPTTRMSPTTCRCRCRYEFCYRCLAK